MNTILKTRTKKLFFAFIAIFNTALAISQTEYEYKKAKVKPLNQTEINNSYVFRNDENKYKKSSLIKFTAVTNYEITNDFLNDISTLLDAVNSLKTKVNNTNDIEILNKSIFLLQKLQYNMTSTDGIVYYDATIKHTNYSNIETIETLTVIVRIDQFLNGKYQPNRLKWLWEEIDKERLIKSVHSEEREKFRDISSEILYIQERENIRESEKIKELNKIKELEKEIYNYDSVEIKPEFPGGMEKFYKFISNNFENTVDENFKGGKLMLSFVVETDGTLSNIKNLKEVDFASEKEAIRVLKKSPRWIPAEQNGEKIRVEFTFPINVGNY